MEDERARRWKEIVKCDGRGCGGFGFALGDQGGGDAEDIAVA